MVIWVFRERESEGAAYFWPTGASFVRSHLPRADRILQRTLDEITTDGYVIERGVGLRAVLAEGLAEGAAGRGNDFREAVSLPVEAGPGP